MSTKRSLRREIRAMNVKLCTIEAEMTKTRVECRAAFTHETMMRLAAIEVQRASPFIAMMDEIAAKRSRLRRA